MVSKIHSNRKERWTIYVCSLNWHSNEKKNKNLFRFQAHRWLSEEKDDQKTYIDLSPDEQKTPPSSPVPQKGR
jgi:hypothetical protein